jgi:hypothetical protein
MAAENHVGQGKNTAPTTLTRSVHKNLDSSGYGGGIRVLDIRDPTPTMHHGTRRWKMELLHQRCCGLDVHKETVVACLRLVSDGKVTTEVAG